ncbi:MAG: MarR family winged helix-turn-helix transcriptional regulator [Proteobacteria bacterium]|nr:MarR family winged helix-turn-helix transcriptional regulator [Pseudomonadota bacterium]MBU2518546.1 MarR family winged helix-turn-helix transcriptional regulator [Pseudomonadota bacterium]
MTSQGKPKSGDAHVELPIILDREHCMTMARTCAAYNLRRASRLVTQAFDQALSPTGLKVTQFSLLVSFLLSPGSNMVQLAHWLGMDRTTLSRNLKVLEKRGLVEMVPGEDRREQQVRITPAGRKLFEQACPLWFRAQERVVGGIGHEKWSALAKELRSLVAGLK